MRHEGGASYNFTGRVAIVTGGAGGFGVSIARHLLKAGASVALWDTRDDTFAELEDLRRNSRTYALTVDVTDESAVAKAARATVSRFGKIDTLVNNAGVFRAAANAREHTTRHFRRVLDVNLVGAYICSKAVVPWMLRNEVGNWRGRIVNVAPIMDKEGTPQAAAYAASKAGLMALTRTLGKEMAQSGILVNVITPAAEPTLMTDEIAEEIAEETAEERRGSILACAPMARFLESNEVASQVMWLCSGDCSFVTGGVFDLSGGRHAG